MQSVWLMAATIAAVLTFFVPFSTFPDKTTTEITISQPKSGDQIIINVDGKKFDNFKLDNTSGVPKYTFTLPPQTTAGNKLMASTYWYLIALTLLSAIGSLIAIFLYHDRKLQMRINIAALFMSAILLIIYILFTFKTSGSIPSLTCLLYLGIPFVQYLSLKGISNDQKVVEDSEHLR